MASNNARNLAATLTLNGEGIGGLLSLDISTNAYLAAGRFSARIAMDSSGYTPWSAATLDVSFDVAVGDASATLMQGGVDRVSFDASRQEIAVEGRDFTAPMIDSQWQQSLENQSASEVIGTIASRHGLSLNAASTQGFVGRDFQNDYMAILLAQHTKSMTEWDLAARLANLANCEIWVSGRTLNFQPATADNDPIMVTPAMCTSLRLERSVVLSGGVSVAVRSWDCRGSQIVTQSSPSPAGTGQLPQYVYSRPNLSAQSAQAMASRMAAQITRRGRVVMLEMPGELVAAPRRGIALSATGTDFDGVYEIVSVDRHLSFADGYTQIIEAIAPSWTT